MTPSVPFPPPERAQITGLVLAGGLGSRMGGVDKGLQPLHGRPLVAHALARLAPQVGALALNANRDLERHAAWGAPVWPDTWAGHPGPLAGMLAGLQRCGTPWLATVPCDSPFFPSDLVARLAATVAAEGAEIGVAATIEAGELRRQPVFSLLSAGVADSLAQALREGERKIGRWMARRRLVTVVFNKAQAFTNVNTLDELQRLEQGPAC